MNKKLTPRVTLSLRAELHIGSHVLDLNEMRTLLRAVADSRTITAAAEAIGATYRTLWGRLETYDAALGHAVVDKLPGQGTQLTATGRALLAALDAHAIKLRAPEPALADALSASVRAAIGGGAAPLRLAASHDFAIANALAKSGSKAIDVRFVGSADAARALTRGEAELAGFHAPAGAGTNALDATLQAIRTSENFWCTPLMEREQGIMVAAGNPRKIRALVDLAKPGVRFVNRQRGSGTRMLLDELLRAQGLNGDAINGYAQEEFTHQAVAAMISAGAADAGLGLRAAAAQFKLEFIPLGRETYFIAGGNQVRGNGDVRALIEHAQREAALLPGYSVT